MLDDVFIIQMMDNILLEEAYQHLFPIFIVPQG